ncbi:MAG: oxaloacetate decarboxylase gamma subunit [Halioglobus sp.]|jgi:oxaloacetate decarboxylase gamma subunit
MDGDIVEQGLELMLFGMGTVVVFLTLLIIVTTAMSWFLGRYLPEEAQVPIVSAGQTPPVNRAKHNQVPPIAVITAAIHQHRSNNKKRSS